MSRFASVSSDEIDNIIQNKDAENTRKQLEVFFLHPQGLYAPEEYLLFL